MNIKGELVVSMQESQPRLDIKILVDLQAYQQYGLTCKLSSQFTNHRGKLMTPLKLSMVTDTSAQEDTWDLLC